jgi:hypothetical protein
MDSTAIFMIISTIIIIIFFGYQILKMSKKGQFEAIYAIMYLIGIIFAMLILVNALSAYKPNVYKLSSFLTVSVMDIVSTLGALVLGIVSLEIAQKKYKDDRNEKISDNIASPLYLEVEELKKEILENLFTLIDMSVGNYNSIWISFKKTSKKIVATDISKNMVVFYEGCNDYCRNLNTIYAKKQNIIITELDSMLKKNTEILTVKNSSDFFRAVYEDGYGKQHNINLTKYIMLNISLIENLSIEDFDYPRFLSGNVILPRFEEGTSPNLPTLPA